MRYPYVMHVHAFELPIPAAIPSFCATCGKSLKLHSPTSGHHGNACALARCAELPRRYGGYCIMCRVLYVGNQFTPPPTVQVALLLRHNSLARCVGELPALA